MIIIWSNIFIFKKNYVKNVVFLIVILFSIVKISVQYAHIYISVNSNDKVYYSCFYLFFINTCRLLLLVMLLLFNYLWYLLAYLSEFFQSKYYKLHYINSIKSCVFINNLFDKIKKISLYKPTSNRIYKNSIIIAI